MRKMALVFIAVLSLTACSFSASASVTDKIVLYIPNRIIDLTDIFSGSIGFGPSFKLDAHTTRFLDFGFGAGSVANLVKGYNQQYGGALDNGWSAGFLCLSGEDFDRESCSRSVKSYSLRTSGVADPSDPVYDVFTGARDFWEVGFEFALLADISFAIHPIEIADFVTGWFFIDLKGDDPGSEDMK